MLTVLEFVARDGSSPFASWFAQLDAAAAAKVTTAISKKKGQQHDIASAQARWKDYKQRKSQENRGWL